MKLIELILYTCIGLVLSDDSCCPVISTRDEWNGRSADEIAYLTIPVVYVVIQHTVTATCSTEAKCAETVRNIQAYHIDEAKFGDIGYNFLIGNDGIVYEGRGWHKEGAHTYGWNKKAIGIAFIGDFESELPSQAALDAAKDLLKCGVEKGELKKRYILLGARQVQSTESPGLKLYREIKKWKNWVLKP